MSWRKCGENSMQSNQCEFTLKNCNAVKELVIGQGSFTCGLKCLIEYNDSLKVIRVGDLLYCHQASCFQNGYMELKNLPSLTRAVFGRDVCRNCLSARFENLPELTTIRFGDCAFSFSDQNSGILIMVGLPKLKTITTDNHQSDSSTFRFVFYCMLQGLPSVQTIDLPMAFMRLMDSRVYNSGGLERLVMERGMPYFVCFTPTSTATKGII
ncbi:hypothetical protein BLSTO_05931 [Blastocystis sp. subtype 1]